MTIAWCCSIQGFQMFLHTQCAKLHFWCNNTLEEGCFFALCIGGVFFFDVFCFIFGLILAFRGFWLLWLLAFVASVAFVAFGFGGFRCFRGFWLSWLLWLLRAAHLWIWCPAGGGAAPPPNPPGATKSALHLPHPRLPRNQYFKVNSPAQKFTTKQICLLC